jgi:plastocyanin
VTFRNHDGTTHTITSGTRTSPTGAFDADLGPDEELVLTFAEAGTHDYFCRIHDGGGMTGQVVVG